jgi:hypothetical protein
MERLRGAEEIPGGLPAEYLPDALGNLERLKGKLWSRVNALTGRTSERR